MGKKRKSRPKRHSIGVVTGWEKTRIILEIFALAIITVVIINTVEHYWEGEISMFGYLGFDFFFFDLSDIVIVALIPIFTLYIRERWNKFKKV